MNIWKDRLYIVMAIEHYNPLGQIRSLGEAGARPVYIAIKGRARLASLSRYVSQVHYVDTVEEGYRVLLAQYGDHYKKTGYKPFLFCSDDRSVGYLDLHYEELKDRFIFFNAGEPGRINRFMDKSRILELAQSHGLKVLDYRVCERGQLPQGLDYPIITKSISPNVGGWKSDVYICHSEQELKDAYLRIQAPTVLVQRYIEKENEYCLEGFSANGGNDVLIAIASTYNYLLPNYYSPYMTVQNMEDEFLRAALSGMLKEIGYEGVFEIEFLIDRDGTKYFGEINFRNSTWSYASTVAGMPLPVLWAQTQESGHLREDAWKKIEEPFTAMVEPVDYAKRVKTGQIDPAQWLADFKEARCCYYFNAKDLAPWRACLENWDALG